MYSGTVVITSKILNPGIQFHSFVFDARHLQVKSAEMVSVSGHEIASTIKLDNVATTHGVEDIALAIHMKALLRLGCLYNFVIEKTTSSVLNLRSKIDPDSDILLARGVVATTAVGNVSLVGLRNAAEAVIGNHRHVRGERMLRRGGRRRRGVGGLRPGGHGKCSQDCGCQHQLFHDYPYELLKACFLVTKCAQRTLAGGMPAIDAMRYRRGYGIFTRMPLPHPPCSENAPATHHRSAP